MAFCQGYRFKEEPGWRRQGFRELAVLKDRRQIIIHGMRRSLFFVYLTLFVVLIAACQPPAGQTYSPSFTSPAISPRPGSFATVSATPAPSLTQPGPSSTPTASASATWASPSQTPSAEAEAFTLLGAVDFAVQNDRLHDLIVFSSASAQPFADRSLDLPPADGSQLWAISPDGLRLGRLTDQGFAAYLPSSPAKEALFVAPGAWLENPHLRALALPQECQGVLRENEQALGESLPCSDFAFSDDGRYLGMLFGPLDCSRGILILDTLTGKTVYRSDAGIGRWFAFGGKGQILLAIGNCQSGALARLRPGARLPTYIGTGWFGEPELLWNDTHSALAVRILPPGGLAGSIWGYNLELNWDFLPEPGLWDQFDDQALWTPGGRYLLYHHRPISIEGERYAFDAPRKIWRVDSISGEKVLLAGSRVADYHLCADASAACEVSGDWVSVWRAEFAPQSLPADVDAANAPAASCLLYGRGCSPEAERYAMNWRTGEKIAWAQFTPPAPPPLATPLPPGPDLALAPVYAHPSGEYAFYTNTAGTALWWVPQNGEPRLWIQEGQGFLYLP